MWATPQEVIEMQVLAIDGFIRWFVGDIKEKNE